MRNHNKSEQEGPNEELTKRLWHACKSAAMNVGATPEEAEEVAQETILKVLKKWNSKKFLELRSEGDKALICYARTMAKNQHVDLVRSHVRRGKRQELAAGSAGDLPERPNAKKPPKPRDPSGVEAFLARKAILERIAEVKSERQRTCLELTYCEDLDPHEIAARLEIDVQTARHHLKLGHANLRRDFMRWALAHLMDPRQTSEQARLVLIDLIDIAYGDEQATCLRKFMEDGRSPLEIARELGLDLKVVQRHIKEGMDLFRALLKLLDE